MDIEEKYIFSRKNQTIKKVTDLMEEYRIDEIIAEIEGLFLDLSRVYIKSTREKVNSDSSGKVLFAIKDVYIDVLKMFSILCPFTTEKIWQDLREKKIVNEESVHLTSWPKQELKLIDKKLEEEFKIALQVIERGLYSRDKAQIGLKWPLANAIVNVNKKIDKELIELIKSQLNIKEIKLKVDGEEKEISVELDTKMTLELESEGYAREISRKIQAARKTVGFIKSDKIKLNIETPEEIGVLLEKQIEFIRERVNAKDLLINSIDGKYDHSVEDKIKGKAIKIEFSRI